MTRTHFLLLAVTTLFLVAWLAPVRRDVARSGSSGVARSEANVRADEQTAEAIRARTRDLRVLLSVARPFPPVARNPFVFRGAMRPADAAVRADAARVAPRPVRPEMSLEGVAEDAVQGATVRTAVISVLGEVVFAREGDRVLSRFLVLRIAADAVQLKDGEGGDVFTLALK